ncbi:MAG: hypothetical protein MUC88_27750 [Planctomycetes bacterium]|nr:hypothetical protein [Planctomycetota bacterium]
MCFGKSEGAVDDRPSPAPAGYRTSTILLTAPAGPAFSRQWYTPALTGRPRSSRPFHDAE